MTTLVLLAVNQAVARSHRFYNETKCAQRLTATLRRPDFDFLCGPLRNPPRPLRLIQWFGSNRRGKSEVFAENAERTFELGRYRSG